MKKTISMENFLFWGLCALIIFIPFREILAYYTISLVKSLPDLLILLLLIAYLINVKFHFRFELCDWLFGAYLIWELISTVFINHWGLKPYILQVRSISLYYLMFFILRNASLSSHTYQKLIPVIKGVAYGLFALALVEKLFCKTILFPVEWKESIIYMDNYVRTYGVFNNPNTYAAFILFSFFYIYQQTTDFWEKKNWLFIFVSFTGLLLTVSRSAILLLMFFFIVLAIYQWVVKKQHNSLSLVKGKPFLICLVVSLAVWGGAEVFSNYYMDHVVLSAGESSNMSSLDRFNELMGDKIISGSQANGRMYSIKKGWEIVKDYPLFGAGFGTYGSSASLICGSPIYDKYEIEPGFYSDNEYIKLLVEGGFVGALIFIGFLGAVLYRYRRERFKLLICIIMGGLGLFYNIFEVQVLAFLFWLTLSAPLKVELKGDCL